MHFGDVKKEASQLFAFRLKCGTLDLFFCVWLAVWLRAITIARPPLKGTAGERWASRADLPRAFARDRKVSHAISARRSRPAGERIQGGVSQRESLALKPDLRVTPQKGRAPGLIPLPLRLSMGALTVKWFLVRVALHTSVSALSYLAPWLEK
ncbi:hypothetical protein C0Q70_03600 [Pomacea canaliculata]|uniref:Uncharacterized protein n=1 Tax=Pomacea canaliculata TaxID=400727 RepID=A0A2T7PT73_POMCA|nr:hypothetical protein C0Q70_03600 [Pomacea canaliculata]